MEEAVAVQARRRAQQVRAPKQHSVPDLFLLAEHQVHARLSQGVRARYLPAVLLIKRAEMEVILMALVRLVPVVVPVLMAAAVSAAVQAPMQARQRQQTQVVGEAAQEPQRQLMRALVAHAAAFFVLLLIHLMQVIHTRLEQVEQVGPQEPVGQQAEMVDLDLFKSLNITERDDGNRTSYFCRSQRIELC